MAIVIKPSNGDHPVAMTNHEDAARPTVTTPAAAARVGDGQGERRTLQVRLATDAVGLERIRNVEPFASAVFKTERASRAIYFDTPSLDLWKRGWVLCVRRIGRAWTMRLRQTDPEDDLFARSEIEILQASPQPDIDLFGTAVAEALRAAAGAQPLEPRFSAQLRRSVTLVQIGAAQVEAAFEEGHILAGSHRLPVIELGLRLECGEPAAFFDFANALTSCAPLRLELLSKGRRGFMLIGEERAKPFRAREVCLDPQATLDTAIATIIRASLEQFARNLAALEPSEPEAIHQARVALRRLRTALAQFQRVLPCTEFALFRQQAKELATALGAAREWDIFLEAIGACASTGDDDGFETLMTAAEDRRGRAYAAALSLVDGSDASRFVLGLEAFVTRRGWRNTLSGEELPKLTQPASAFAAAEMQRLRKRILKRGKDLLNAPPEERHKVRIASKNLRYAGEFFHTVLNGSRTTEQMRLASRLQSVLGTSNDAISTIAMTRGLAGSVGPAALRASGFVEGWFTRGATDGDGELAALWRRFRETKPRWV